MSKRLKLYCLIILVLTVAIAHATIVYGGKSDRASYTHQSGAVIDPTEGMEGYSAVIYDNTNGLPTSEANAIAETKDGFIWIGSYSGLIRYDGNTFTRITSNTATIGCVIALCTDSKDRLWIGSNDSGISVMEKGEFRSWGKAEGLKSTHVRKIIEDKNGNIYAASTAGLLKFDLELNLSVYDDSRLSNANILTIRTGNNGEIYGLTNEGDFFKIRDDELVSYINSYDFGLLGITDIIADPDNEGYYYICSDQSILYYGKPGSNALDFEEIDISPIAYVTNLEYIDGKMWICARNGLGALDEYGFHLLENIPMKNSIGSVMTDYEGNLWFTSTRQGVMKIVPNRFTNIFERYNLESTVVNSTCLYNDMLFVATDSGLIVLDEYGVVPEVQVTYAHYANGFEIDTTNLIDFFDGCRIRSILKDSKGRMWFSTWHKHGVLCYDNGELTCFNIIDGLLSDSTRAICEREDGSIIVAVSGGVNVIEGIEITESYGLDQGIQNTETLTVCDGTDGDILVGSDGGGIYIIHNGEVRHIGTEDGLTSDIILRIKHDKKRNIFWIITSNSICYMTADYQITEIKNFPYSNNFDMYENANGDMWIISSNGLYIVPVSQLLENKEINPVHYGMANGLPCIATANSYSELTENGDLYIAGAGVAKVNIDSNFENLTSLKVAVPYIDIDGIRTYPNEDGSFVISKKAKKITIYSYVFNYSLTDPLVSYCLDGFDQEFTTLKRSELVPVDYTNLSGGSYLFIIKLEDTVTHNQRSVYIKLIKDKAFYEYSWFLILFGLIIVSLFVFIVYAIVRKKLRSMEQKNREEAEKERLTTELNMANRIQESMLPNVFPAFPDRKEFDIYATMEPAKEVGGDFYDFFMIDDDHLCMVISDVSGKGIPAALYMMIAKTTLQNCAMLGSSPAEIMTKTNDSLCSNNQTEMFVTSWLGILEISTGKLTASNAGHEYPVLTNEEGKYELVKRTHNFVLGGMEDMVYSEYELTLRTGDRLFVYTDGVPEATDPDEQLFGTDRMLTALNTDPTANPETTLKNVRMSVNAFVREAEQFDDLTMLCLEYKGKTSD